MKAFSSTVIILALLLALTATDAASAQRPVTAAWSLHRVGAYSIKTHSFTLRAGRLYTIIIDGDDDTDLDLYLYDENWQLIGSDRRSSDYGRVQVRPRWTGTFYVVVENLGWVYNEYSLRIRR